MDNAAAGATRIELPVQSEPRLLHSKRSRIHQIAVLIMTAVKANIEEFKVRFVITAQEQERCQILNVVMKLY
jgi:competence protein ComGF